METTNIDKIENSGTAVLNSSVEGENIAFGDIHQHYYTETFPSFSTIKFDNNNGDPEPVFMGDILDILEDQRVVVILGDDDFDQANLGKQVVYNINQKHESYNTIELIQNEDNKSIFNELSQQNENQIILLNSIHPKHIKYDFSKLVELSVRNESYFVITTESSKETWMKSGYQLEDCWLKIPKGQNLFNTEELNSWILKEFRNYFPTFFKEDFDFTIQTKLSETITLENLVKQISNPDKIKVFLDQYSNLDEFPSDNSAQKMINNLKKTSEEIISKWFNNLNHNERVIAVSAALFNGLFCNQYFEILIHLVDNTFWGQSNKELKAIDYHNLDFLLLFFRFEHVEEGKIIVAKNNNIRILLIKIAKDQYARHIEKALTVFSAIMKNTYARKLTNWELFGTKQKRALLRQVFIETTRDLGINELSNIESIYLELASNDHDYIQGVAAKSLAQYRVFEKEELFFSLIDKWLYNKNIEERIDLFLQMKVSKKVKKTAISCVKTMSLRALAYAADYDKPNALHPDIVKRVIHFSSDLDPNVKEAFAKLLPKFIHHHSYQLRVEIFEQLMPISYLSGAISEGLKLAYNDYPEALKKVVNHWLSVCARDSSNENRRKKGTVRDYSLITVLKVLQKIEIQKGIGFTLEEIYTLAIPLIDSEKRTIVIDQVVLLFTSIQCQDFGLAYKYIDKTIARFPKRIRKIVIKEWGREYIQERQELLNSPYSITIDGLTYSAWSNLNERPLVRIENDMFKWLNSNSKVAQKYATIAFLEFAKAFEVEEYSKIKILRYEIKKREQYVKNLMSNKSKPTTKKYTYEKGLGFRLRIKIFIYLLFENKEKKQSLKEIIKLIYNSNDYSNEDLKFAIYKWEARNKGELSSKLAKWLMRFLKI